MLKAFNAFQFVCLFSALPYGILWLYTATFPFAGAALVTACVVYLIMWIMTWASVCHAAEDFKF